MDLTTGLLYAVPLSIMSSAIIIPSVSALDKDKKEFMVYESTFSDILGIMLFYFLSKIFHLSSLLITLESSFIVRTFFFVIFGFTIVLASLLDLKVWLVSLSILGILYGLRYAYFRFIIRKDIYPSVWMAPRGLITILLYYSIPETLWVELEVFEGAEEAQVEESTDLTMEQRTVD